MNRLSLETNLIKNIQDLPDDKLLEVLEFALFLKTRITSPIKEKKSSFIELMRQSPLVDLEIEHDSSLCRTLDL